MQWRSNSALVHTGKHTTTIAMWACTVRGGVTPKEGAVERKEHGAPVASTLPLPLAYLGLMQIPHKVRGLEPYNASFFLTLKLEL